MTEGADIVVAGGGHNSLITAAYLAKAGHECVVLDARDIPGGGAATEELLGPGYKIDSCSTGHTIIRVNPLLLNDELGLHSDYGLEYFEPDPVGHVAFPDGEQLTMWLDLDRTCDEIARFSRSDAEGYRRLIAEYDEVKGIFGRARVTPPGFGPSLEELLLEHPRGRIWLRRHAISAWDVIRREFSDRHVQAFMIWQAFQTLVPVDAAGSGVNAYSIIFGRQGRSWSVPRGGSGALTDALTRFLEDRGSTVLTNRQVSGLVLEDGRCTGIETDDGERYMARQAVLSTIHVKHLMGMAPRDVWGEEFVYGVDTYDVGMSAMACYLATDAAPEFRTPDGPRAAVSAGTVGWPAEEHILTSFVKSPADIEASNQHMIRGAFHGGDRSYAFSGRNRPVPGWADHRMPIPGLYQTGGTTSVGGSVTGVPGRSAAMVMLTDLGHDPEEVMAGAGRARAGSR